MAKPSFIGLDTHYLTADGQRRRRIHMDGAASPLAAATALQTIQDILPHYSNTHSYVHTSAQITTRALSAAHDQVLDYLHADAADYTAIFTGAGTTAGINRLARGLAAARADRKVVLVSAMEHHANDLPHRQFGNQVHYLPLTGAGANQGTIDLQELEGLLRKHQGRVNYLACCAVSNVTGIVNPVTEITRLAHKYDTLVLLDAAQAVAHRATHLSRRDSQDEVDFMVFSGHKVYTPTAPGVLVAKKSLLHSLAGQDLGGGSVSTVSYYDYELLTEFPHKEQSGTPNIVGAIALARVMQALDAYGFERIEQHSRGLTEELLEVLLSLPKLTVYGDPDATRIGALAFNHQEIDHGLLAAILNDYFAIAVRNECFCAHPYVSSLLREELWELDLSGVPEEQQATLVNQKRGMVRASLSLYNSSDDIEALVTALAAINRDMEMYRSQYRALEDGSYRHKSFLLDWRAELGWQT